MVMAIIMIVITFVLLLGVLGYFIYHIVTKTPIDLEGCSLHMSKKNLLKKYHKMKRRDEKRKAKASKSTI